MNYEDFDFVVVAADDDWSSYDVDVKTAEYVADVFATETFAGLLC